MACAQRAYISPTVVRARETERALASGASADEAAAILGREIAPIDDVRSTGDYRRTVAMNLLRRFWLETREDAPLALAEVDAFAFDDAYTHEKEAP